MAITPSDPYSSQTPSTSTSNALGVVGNTVDDSRAIRDLQSSAQSNVSSVQGQINDANQTLSGLNASLQSINGQVSIATTLLETLVAQSQDLQSQRGRPGISDADKQRIDGQLQALGPRIAFVQQQIGTLQRDAADTTKQVTAQQAKIDDLSTNGIQRAADQDSAAQQAANSQKQSDDAQRAQEQTQDAASQQQYKKQVPGPLDINYGGEPGSTKAQQAR